MNLPSVSPSGPCPSSLLILGDFPGITEVKRNEPFSGSSGIFLQKMLSESGLDFSSAYKTYVFKTKPPNNSPEYFYVPTKSASPDSRALGLVGKGRYINDIYIPQIRQLHSEIAKVRPKIILALGDLPLWALLNKHGIAAQRGVVSEVSLDVVDFIDSPLFVIPTYDPASVLKAYSLRSIVLSDLQKLKGYLNGSTQPTNPADIKITINPTIEEVEAFVEEASVSPQLSIDVETKKGFIRTIGFATNPTRAFVVPFWEDNIGDYWPEPALESRAMVAVRNILLGTQLKIFQNGIYDLQYIWKIFGMKVVGPWADLMLAHHALQPEMQKSLGFIASIYLDHPAWKVWRKEHAEKVDD